MTVSGYDQILGLQQRLPIVKGPFWACVPSKALLRSPEVLQTAKTTQGAKERVNGDRGVDTKALFQRRDKITMGWDDTVGLVPLIQSTGAQMVRGFGKLVGEKKVQVTPHQGEPIQLEARLAVVLCTGSSSTLPDIPGLKDADPWQPRDATSSTTVPDHLIVMGGGVVGVECATAYISYGKKVTLVCHSSELLPRVDSEAGKLVRLSLEKKGVTVLCSTAITKVQRSSPNKLTAELSNGDRLEGSELLVAAGRKANLEGLGLDSVGVSADDRFLPVDEHLRVKGASGRWLFAAGDINGRSLLTHTSKYHAAIAANAILADSKGGADDDADYSETSATADRYAVPQVIFTDPVVASVGLTRAAAASRGLKVREITSTMASPGYNIHSDEPADSWAQWLVDHQNCLVGATFVGADAAETLHASTVAIVGKIPLERMMHAIPSFPTLSWVYYNLLDAAGL